MNSLGMMQEIDERQGNYQMLQQNADTWTTMGQEVIKARRVLNGQETGNTSEAQEVLERAARIAYATRSASMAGPSLVPEGDDHAPVPAPGGGARAGRDAGAGAPGRVQEEVNSFLAIADQHAGPYQGPPGPLPGPTQAPVTSPTDAMDAQNTRNNNGRTS